MFYLGSSRCAMLICFQSRVWFWSELTLSLVFRFLSAGKLLLIPVSNLVAPSSTGTLFEQQNSIGPARSRFARTGDQCGLSVFFISHEARARGLVELVAQIVEGAGFELLRTIDLDECRAGTYSVNGTPPAAVLVAFDVVPSRVEDGIRALFPDLDNGHIHEAELRCRELIEAQAPPMRDSALMHSTRNSAEAWRVIRHVLPHSEQALRKTIESRKSAMVTHFEVVRDLTRRGTRSKVELIRYGERLAVENQAGVPPKR